MDDRVWKNISIALGVICALLIGVAGALLIVGGHKGGTTAANATPTPTQAVVGSQNPSGSIRPSGSTSPNTGPTATPGLVSPATITFTNLGLDASKDSLGAPRTFSITTDGTGPVSGAVTKVSSGGTVKLCYNVDGGPFSCVINTKTSKLIRSATAAMNTSSASNPSTWTFTVQGYGDSHPTVSLALTWPTSTPVVKMSYGRFQGTGASDSLNGFTATVTPRGNGAVNVQANWGDLTTDATVTLLDTTSTPAFTIAEVPYSQVTEITNPPFTANVEQKTYQVRLARTTADGPEHPSLTAQISFP